MIIDYMHARHILWNISSCKVHLLIQKNQLQAKTKQTESKFDSISIFSKTFFHSVDC